MRGVPATLFCLLLFLFLFSFSSFRRAYPPSLPCEGCLRHMHAMSQPGAGKGGRCTMCNRDILEGKARLAAMAAARPNKNNIKCQDNVRPQWREKERWTPLSCSDEIDRPPPQSAQSGPPYKLSLPSTSLPTLQHMQRPCAVRINAQCV